MNTFLVFSLLFCFISARPSNEPNPIYDFKSTCGYDSCHPTKEGVLNIHIVAHTHDDVGWLKTVDQYYYGSNSMIQKAGVQYIIDSVIDELLKDPKRRFVYVETSFFAKWWSEQTDIRRHQVKSLVSEGRLEFAGGAWSMNDEAAAHYQSVLDQLTWGLRMLNDTFGSCGIPKAGWQIDPFGHSKELANMWALSGFDGLLLGRVDYQDKKRRINAKELEMVWRSSEDLGKKSDLLTGIMFNTYSPPPGFCFDIVCADEPFIDDKHSPDYNVDRLVTNFVNYIRTQSNAYKTNNLIVTMGGDFTYQDALVWYKNLDKLIKYTNERFPDLNLIYSTPGCYIKSLHDSKVEWPIKQDDFFPYASDPHSFWTGYFTSRPTSKYFERRGNNVLQACKQLYALTNLEKRDEKELNSLRSAMGIFQHHDAITGTEKQHVANDYARILESGIQDCLNISSEAINKLMLPQSKNDESQFPMIFCQLNETKCSFTETSKEFIVTLYNPLSHEVKHSVRLPVNGPRYIVKDGQGTIIDNEIMAIDPEVLPGKVSAAGELIFQVTLPSLGYKSYFVSELDSSDPDIITGVDDDSFIKNEYLTVTIGSDTGHIKNIKVTDINGQDGFILPLEQQLMYYHGMSGDNIVFERRASGAYIFRPNGTTAYSFGKPRNKYYKGRIVQEIHQKFSDWATQIIRLYRGEKHVQMEWIVGPIPIDDNIGKEVISRYSTLFQNNGAFYTDSNGRQLLKRIRNKRPTWDIELNETVSGNYYPVTSMIGMIEPMKNIPLFVVTDRAQGGGSIKDGEMELMVHRRLLHDDAFGVGEPLNEVVGGVGLVAKGTHYIVLGSVQESDLPAITRSRLLALQDLLQPIVFLSPTNNLTYDEWKNNKNEFSGAIKNLPTNLHILTLEPWKSNSVLLRLENIVQKGEGNLGDINVDLNTLFPGMKITSIRETLLAASQWKDEAVRLDCEISGRMVNNFNEAYTNSDENANSRYKRSTNDNDNRESNFVVTLTPMEIRTFIINVEYLN